MCPKGKGRPIKSCKEAISSMLVSGVEKELRPTISELEILNLTQTVKIWFQ